MNKGGEGGGKEEAVGPVDNSGSLDGLHFQREKENMRKTLKERTLDI